MEIVYFLFTPPVWCFYLSDMYGVNSVSMSIFMRIQSELQKRAADKLHPRVWGAEEPPHSRHDHHGGQSGVLRH